MTQVRVQQAAVVRIKEIYEYTCEHWGNTQAESYVTGLFEAFENIEAGTARSRPIPAEFEVDG